MPARDTQDRFPHNAVLEAGFALRRCTFSNLEKHYKPELLEAAEKAFGPGGLCLREMIGEIAEANGYTGSKYIDSRNIETAMDFAWKAPLQAAGSSTLSLRNILSNLANKEKLDAFTEEDATWRQIAIVKSVSDLKEVTSHRLLDDMEYEELSPDGEIKHGELSEEMYTHQAHTYAKMFTLTRTHIINDNLGALDDVRTRLGAGAARKLNTVFWSTFLNNAAHFTAARGNFISGATTNLGLDGVGLQAGVLAFSKLQSADGKRIGGNPEILLIPPELKVIADMLYQSTNVNTGGSSTKDTVPNANIPAGKYTPVVSPWLSEASFAGNSATAWYLLRKPSIHAAVVVSFLNGVQVPTVEVADSDFNKLGIQFRGYFDFGVNLREPLAGIKSKGAA